MNVVVKFLVLGFLIFLPLQSVNAAESWVLAKVKKVITSVDKTWGGCMVELTVNPATKGLDCPSAAYVSFSCSGDFNTKEEALRLFDSAQLAYALDHRLLIKVIDTRKHNGFCTASQIQVFK